VHVPNLLASLAMSASSRYLCYGGIAHAGYNPQTFRMCGWSWQRGMRAWRARNCEARAMSRPFPFPLGAVQLLSSPLVKLIGTSPEVSAFSAAANRSEDLRKRESNEDVALGYWISRFTTRHGLNTTCAPSSSLLAEVLAIPLSSWLASRRHLHQRASGEPRVLSARRVVPSAASRRHCHSSHQGCGGHAVRLASPQPASPIIRCQPASRTSRLRELHARRYVWSVLHDGRTHDPLQCAKDSEVEIPRNSFIFTRHFMDKIQSGDASVSFDGKTNRMTMSFHRKKLPASLNSSAFFSKVARRVTGTGKATSEITARGRGRG
jgi:hypothetical protein